MYIYTRIRATSHLNELTRIDILREWYTKHKLQLHRAQKNTKIPLGSTDSTYVKSTFIVILVCYEYNRYKTRIPDHPNTMEIRIGIHARHVTHTIIRMTYLLHTTSHMSSSNTLMNKF